jgi:hypothetical protein
VLIEILLYTTTLRVIYLINLLETLNYPRIALTIKIRHLVAGRGNNYSFPTLYRNRYLIRLLKHLIKSILIKITIIQRAIYKRIRFGEVYKKIYLNYFRDLEGYGKAKIGLPKLIKD